MNPKVTSAGGLIVKHCKNGWKTVLVGSGDPVIWRIPKGMAEEGESIEQTAEREVLEETGIRGQVVELLGTASWTYIYDSKNWDETAYFFLMKLIDGSIENHDEEFDVVKWFYLEDAVNALYYKDEAEITEKTLTITKNIKNFAFFPE
jgi:8-oxo-dGTP pyrophosphatase MutT (NUDIX family)